MGSPPTCLSHGCALAKGCESLLGPGYSAGRAGLPLSFHRPGQIDPANRELVQVGYNAALEGQSPLAAYAFYYRNQPDFLQHTNLTLRLAVAPTYLDSELGFKSAAWRIH